jgi:hypothetical protein
MPVPDTHDVVADEHGQGASTGESGPTGDRTAHRRGRDRYRDRRPPVVPGTNAARGDRRDGRLIGDDRGVSEVIGFVLSFSVIILSVGLVFTYGFAAVQDMREAEQLNSAERAMEAVAGTLENLQRGDPARASEVRVAGGQMDIRNRTRVTVTVEDSASPPGTLYRYDQPVGELIYSYQGTNLSYQTGAVFRASDSGGGVLARRPTLVCNDDRAVVSVVRFRNIEASTGVDSVGAEGSITVAARANETFLLYPNREGTTADDAAQVTLEVDSPHSQIWTDYFDSSSNGWAPTGTPGEATCDTDRVVVRETYVEIKFLV